MQSTFLNAHRALQRGVTPESELAWLLKIAHNVCLTRRRSTRRRGRVEAAHDLESMQDYLPAPTRESPDELIRLNDALEGLPDTQRRAILLREWRGLSYAEIARELKLTQSAVETLIFRARRSLASNLDAVVVKPRLLARARHALELSWLLPALRALFEGGVAVKAATAAVAVSSVAVVATSTDAPTTGQQANAAPERVVAIASKPVAADERPRLQDREATSAAGPTAAASHSNAATKLGKTTAAGAHSSKAKVKLAKTRPLHARGVKAKKRTGERAARVKVTKTKRVAPTRRAKARPKKAKPKRAKTQQAAPPKPEQPKAAGPEKPAEQKPEPSNNGKSK